MVLVEMLAEALAILEVGGPVKAVQYLSYLRPCFNILISIIIIDIMIKLLFIILETLGV